VINVSAFFCIVSCIQTMLLLFVDMCYRVRWAIRCCWISWISQLSRCCRTAENTWPTWSCWRVWSA